MISILSLPKYETHAHTHTHSLIYQIRTFHISIAFIGSYNKHLKNLTHTLTLKENFLHLTFFLIIIYYISQVFLSFALSKLFRHSPQPRVNKRIKASQFI